MLKPRGRVEAEVRFSGKEVAEAAYKSLLPDNVAFPRGLSMKMKVEGKRLILILSSTCSLETLTSTVDGVLGDSQLVVETIERLEEG